MKCIDFISFFVGLSQKSYHIAPHSPVAKRLAISNVR